MTIKEKIQFECNKLETERSTYGTASNCFAEGADFAIKAVIELLENRQKELMDRWRLVSASEIENIINLLKSEA